MLGVQALTQLEGLANIPMAHLLTTILEDWENLGQRNTHSILLGTVLGMTRMEKEEEGATEARNKSRLLACPRLDY